jgi:threonine/homoserine/homoserine lactone efflux protein
MSFETLLAATLFALVSSITPGPNNTMLLASGVNFGFRRSLWHLAGVQIGFWILLLVTALGLHSTLTHFPNFYLVLRIAGGSYLLWMAWKLATSGPTNAEASSQSKPIGFWAAAAFQWINPKAWVMTITCMSTYLPTDASGADMATLIAMFVVVGLPCSLIWLTFGQAMRQWLQDPLRLRIFNVTMAIALVASLYPMLIT